MGVGQTEPSKEARGYLHTQEPDLSGLTRGIRAFTGAIADAASEYASAQQEQANRMNQYKTATELEATKRSMWDLHTTSLQNADPSSTTIPQDTDAATDKLANDFIQRVPEKERPRVQLQLDEYRFQLHQNAVAGGYELNQGHYKRENEKHLILTQNDIAQDPHNWQPRAEGHYEIVRKSGLSPAEKEADINRAKLIFQKTAQNEQGQEQANSGRDPIANQNFFLERASSADITPSSIRNLAPVFANRLTAVINRAERETGDKIKVRDLFRPAEVQAQYKANSLGMPVYFEGKRYDPQPGTARGHRVAWPGHSLHGTGNAADLDDGPARQWMRAHRDILRNEYGVDFLNTKDDLGHIQVYGTVTEQPGSANSRSRLHDAQVWKESGGDPNAVSPKGAVGLMQVMPGTALDIVNRLKLFQDPNLPTDPKAVAEYLKNPEVSTRYGDAYMDYLLKKYHQDLPTALVAYNGGEGTADAWIASGKDDSKIPKESVQYRNDVMSRMGTGYSSLLNDPQFADVPYEDKEAMQRGWDAAAAHNEAQAKAQMKAEQQADFNRMMNRVGEGSVDGLHTAVDNWVERQGPDGDHTQIHQMRELLKKREAEVSDLSDGVAKYADKTQSWDQTNAKDKKMSNAVFKAEAGRDKLQNGDQQYFNGSFLPKAMQTGMIAPEAVDTLTGMVKSGNWALKQKGLELMGALEDYAPDAYKGSVTNDAIKAEVRTWRLAKERPDTEMQFKAGFGGTDAESRAVVQKRREYIRSLPTSDPEYVKAEDVAGHFTSSLPGRLLGGDGNPLNEAGPDQQMMATLKNEFDMYREMSYAQSGDAGGSKAVAYQMLEDKWGHSTFGGQATFMKYPIEKLSLPTIEGSLAWTEEHAREVAVENGDVILPQERVALKVTKETKQDMIDRQNGKDVLPRYQLWKLGRDGQWRNALHGGGLVTFQPSAAQLARNEQYRANLGNKQVLQDALSRVLEQRRGVGVPVDKATEDQQKLEQAQETVRAGEQRLREMKRQPHRPESVEPYAVPVPGTDMPSFEGTFRPLSESQGPPVPTRTEPQGVRSPGTQPQVRGPVREPVGVRSPGTEPPPAPPPVVGAPVRGKQGPPPPPAPYKFPGFKINKGKFKGFY